MSITINPAGRAVIPPPVVPYAAGPQRLVQPGSDSRIQLAYLLAGAGGARGRGTPPPSSPPGKPSGSSGGGGKKPPLKSQREILAQAGLPVVLGTRPGIGKLDAMKKELVRVGLAQKHGQGIKLKDKVWVRGVASMDQRCYDSFKDLSRVLIQLEREKRLHEIIIEQYIPSAFIVEVSFDTKQSEGGVPIQKAQVYYRRRRNGEVGNGFNLQIIDIRDHLIGSAVDVIRTLNLDWNVTVKFLTSSEAGPFYIIKAQKREKVQTPAGARPIWQHVENYLPLPKDTNKVPDELKKILRTIIDLPDDKGGDDAEKYLEQVPEAWEKSLRELSYLLNKEEEEHLARFVSEWWVRRFRPDLIASLVPKEPEPGNEGEGV